MPELPEVETVKRGLEPVWQGASIERAVLNRDNLRYPFGNDFVRRVSGKTALSLSRRGKYLVIDLEDLYLISHLGMSGSFMITDKENYTPRKHDHVLFYLSNGKMLVYHDPRRFGFLLLVDHLEDYPPFAKMGPEPLSNHFNGAELYERINMKKAPIKQLLLDQSIVAGVGNIYACEALYEAQISPLRGGNALNMEECETLAATVKAVLLRAIESGGSTLRDHRKADGEMGYFQHEFAVYDKEGQSCPRCKDGVNTVQRIVQAGRSTFFCPSCQKA